MSDDLIEHFERLEWVRLEIKRLETEVSEYLGRQPYTIKEHLNPWTLIKTYKAVQIEPPPRSAQIRSGTIVNEMRSILDALACTLAIRNSASSVDDVYFPTAKSAAGYMDRRVQKKIRRLSIADQAIINNLKPYAHGNDLLYTLHSADILRKHQRLVLFSNGVDSLTILPGVLDGGKIISLGVLGGDLENGVEIAKLRLGYHQELQISLSVTFAEPKFIQGKSIVTTLNDFADLVHSILKLFN